MSTNESTRPSAVDADLTWFDRFASAASGVVSRAWFFAVCVLLVLVWAPSILVFKKVDTWQLVINTATTIITFLLVALLQNTSTRSDRAVQRKLNALAKGMADLLEEHDGTDDDIRELLAAVGLEHREST